jgi:hypothetical protein
VSSGEASRAPGPGTRDGTGGPPPRPREVRVAGSAGWRCWPPRQPAAARAPTASPQRAPAARPGRVAARRGDGRRRAVAGAAARLGAALRRPRRLVRHGVQPRDRDRAARRRVGGRRPGVDHRHGLRRGRAPARAGGRRGALGTGGRGAHRRPAAARAVRRHAARVRRARVDLPDDAGPRDHRGRARAGAVPRRPEREPGRARPRPRGAPGARDAVGHQRPRWAAARARARLVAVRRDGGRGPAPAGRLRAARHGARLPPGRAGRAGDG